MLECRNLLRCERATKLSILSLLKVSKEVFLSLTALIVAILLWVHSEFEEFFVVLTILPTILVHLLLEVVESVREQCVSINVGEFATLLLSKLYELRIDSSRNLTTLTENHTPHRVVHHHEATLALLHSEKVHQSDVLNILAEWSYQWRVANAWPYILYLVEELDQEVVHRQLFLALLLADVVDSLTHTAKVCHH